MKTTTRIDEKTGDKHITVDIGSEYTYGDWTLYKTADIEAQIRKMPGCDVEGYVLKTGTQLLAKHLGKSVGTYVFSKNKTVTAPQEQVVSKVQTSRNKTVTAPAKQVVSKVQTSRNKTETVTTKQDVSKTQTSKKKKNVINKEG